jgi:hypothetical protein
MAMIRVVWNAIRGVGLLLLLSFIICAVLLVSCLAQLFSGSGSPGHAGRLSGSS